MTKFKIMLSLLTFLSSLSISAATSAAGDLNRVAALRSAYLMSQVHTADDLAGLPIDKKTRDVLNQEIKKLNSKNCPLPAITMPSETRVDFQFSSKRVSIDFAHFTEGALAINGVSVRLDSYKTFYNYRNEIAQILFEPKVAHIRWFPEAQASTNSDKQNDWMKDYLTSSAAAAAVYLRTPKDDNLESALIAAYENENTYTLTHPYGEKHPLTFQTLPTLFQCGKDGHLLRVEQREVKWREDGIHAVAVPLNTLIATKTGYVFKNYNQQEIQMDKNFLMTGSNDGSAEISESFLEGKPYFNFPKIAARCCAKTGCYEKVRHAFQADLQQTGQTYLHNEMNRESAQ